MRRIRYLTYRHRTSHTNRTLGLLLAFNAGAVNAGGFLVLHMYTSHMTGFASQLADSAVLGNTTLLLNALGAIVSFIVGAAVCAMMVNWGRLRHLRSIYALPLLFEAMLMIFFGLMGAVMMAWPKLHTIPPTVLLLSFVMGLQNAVGSKTSGGSVRTTHMTGNITDVGMELGKLVFKKLCSASAASRVRHNPARIRNAASLVLMFVFGGVAGAVGFKTLGFVCVVPLAALLLALSIPPLLRELPRAKTLTRRQLTG